MTIHFEALPKNSPLEPVSARFHNTYCKGELRLRRTTKITYTRDARVCLNYREKPLKADKSTLAKLLVRSILAEEAIETTAVKEDG